MKMWNLFSKFLRPPGINLNSTQSYDMYGEVLHISWACDVLGFRGGEGDGPVPIHIKFLFKEWSKEHSFISDFKNDGRQMVFCQFVCL